MTIETLENIVEEEMKKQSVDILEIRYITSQNSKFTPTQGGFLALDYEGIHYDRVGLFYGFPFTNPDEYISVREVDEKQREIGMIKNLAMDMESESADQIRKQLKMRYFIPKISKIYSIKDEYGYAYFSVKTNFGKCKFIIQMNGGGVVSLTETRILITDLDGNRFEIPDLNTLSGKELKKLDLFI